MISILDHTLGRTEYRQGMIFVCCATSCRHTANYRSNRGRHKQTRCMACMQWLRKSLLVYVARDDHAQRWYARGRSVQPRARTRLDPTPSLASSPSDDAICRRSDLQLCYCEQQRCPHTYHRCACRRLGRMTMRCSTLTPARLVRTQSSAAVPRQPCSARRS